MHKTIEPTRECVINLPSVDQVGHVDRLAMTTGRNPVPEKKRDWGYRHEKSCAANCGMLRHDRFAARNSTQHQPLVRRPSV